MEPADPAEWLAFAQEKVRQFDERGKAQTYDGHFARTMAQTWRFEIECRFPHLKQ